MNAYMMHRIAKQVHAERLEEASRDRLAAHAEGGQERSASHRLPQAALILILTVVLLVAGSLA